MDHYILGLINGATIALMIVIALDLNELRSLAKKGRDKK